MPSQSKLQISPMAKVQGSDTANYLLLKKDLETKKRLSKTESETKSKKSTPVSSLIEWDYKNPKNYYRTNHGKDIGYAKLPKICKVITDNPTFARLRYIKQLGAVFYVYPEATHTRHAHSLGTAHLACELVKILQEQLPEELKMTGAEMLCVIIAALCHDLGHAAFSHLCEEFLIQSDGTKLTHEQMSVLLFDKILEDDDKVRNRLERYLNEDHFNLIKELINPPPFPDNSIPENLLSKKTFLYAIVNNPISGIDVDKLDYLLRDCIRTGVVGITKTDIGKFFATVRIYDDPCEKFKWLAFPVTESKSISAFLEQRQYNHKVAYSHKNVLAINEMLRKAIKLALPIHTLPRDEETNITLQDCFKKENLDMYIRLTDEKLRTDIMYSTSNDPDMIEARKVLYAIENREFYKPIFVYEKLNTRFQCLEEDEIKGALVQCSLSPAFVKDLIVVRKDFHGGRGFNINPMNNVLFYSSTGNTSYHSFPDPSHESVVYILAPYKCKAKYVDIIEAALKKYINLKPRRLFKADQNAI